MFGRTVHRLPSRTVAPMGHRRHRRLAALCVSGVIAAAVSTTAPVAARGAVPTFVNGLSQSVFSSNPADWVRGEAWVESNSDSDGDGRPDRIHIDITRPQETVTDGLKVPVVLQENPYFAGLGPYRPYQVDLEAGGRAAAPGHGAVPRRREHQPDHQYRPRIRVAAARVRNRARRIAGHRRL